MRAAKLLTVIVIIALCPAFAQNAGDNVFSGILVHTIKLQFNQANYWDSLYYYYNQGLEQTIMANAVIDGVAYDSIGVRLKGNSSYNHVNNKKPFKLSFDEYKSSKWDGMKSVSLNNCWEEPTFIREKLHLDFCRSAGIPAPRGNYAQLYINDTLFAFYSLVESVDKVFLSTHYSNKTGDLFKAVDGFGNSAYLSDFKQYDSDTSYYSRYEFKTDGSTTGWPRLIAFIDTLNSSSTPATSIPQMFNLGSIYKAFAADILFANLDSYINSCRNFYFYYLPVSNRFEWIVWDASLSMGAFPTSGVSNVENMNICYVINSANRPLFGKILSTPELKAAYIDTLKSVFTGYFNPASLSAHIDSIANIIRPYVYADQRKMYTNQQFETNIQSDIVVGANNRKPGLKSYLTARYNSVATQIANLSSVEEGNTIIPVELSLKQNYPNPFNPSTKISFTVSNAGYAALKVYNMIGQCVGTIYEGYAQPSKLYTAEFNGARLSSGIYIARLSSGGNCVTKKMVLLK